MTKQQRIEELKKELSSVKGTKCEVYSRVVGYHAPVQRWNEGKQEEFERRKTFEINILD